MGYIESGGGADANVFNAAGLPCVNLCNGTAEIHTADEHITVADLEAMTEVTSQLIDLAAGRLNRTIARFPLSTTRIAQMKIGVAKEIKKDEYRVALTIAGVRELVGHGHQVMVETGAGDGSSISDDDLPRGRRSDRRRRQPSGASRRWC